jgi:hypothetical protein
MSNKKCVYCGLPLRGKGCPYGPNKVHVVIEPNKCIYCGLPLRGKGCAYSPSGSHIMSSEFGLLQAESTKEHFIMKYIMEKLREPVTESKAYELGIINEQGSQIKDPSTHQEKKAWSPLNQYLLRLKRVFGEKLDVLNTELYMENASNLISSEDLVDANWNAEKYLEKVEIEENFKNSLAIKLDEYYNLLKEAEHNGISAEKIEKILLSTLNENISNKSTG